MCRLTIIWSVYCDWDAEGTGTNSHCSNSDCVVISRMEVRNGERDFSSVDSEGGECLLHKHCYSVILKNSILQTT